MKGLAVSNIAWDSSVQDAVLEFFVQCGVSGIEVAPTKIWSDWEGAGYRAAQDVRRRFEANGFVVPALQAVLFGKTDLQVFRAETHPQFLSHMRTVVDIAAGFGSGVIVFGAPKNRQRKGIEEFESETIALDFFGAVGDLCAEADVVLGVEHNPSEYGCDFLTSMEEAQNFISRLKHPFVQLHVDSAGLHMVSDNIVSQLRNADNICHYHISEPMLAPIYGGSVAQREGIKYLLETNYNNWFSIEMMDPGSLELLKKSITTIIEILDQNRRS